MLARSGWVEGGGVLSFGVLGPLRIERAGVELRVESAKQRLVLARLLVADGPVSEDVLIDGLWGQRPPASALSSLRSHVSRLRTVLGRSPADAVLLHEPAGYRLLPPYRLDATEFESQLEEAARCRAAGEVAAARAAVTAALDHWRGEALADVRYEPFAQPAIARWEARRLQALEDRSELDLELGRASTAVADLEALVVEHPLRERAHGLLMLALYRCGLRADALEAFQRVRQVQLDELGLEPSANLRRLHRDILDQELHLDGPDDPLSRARGVAGSSHDMGRVWSTTLDSVEVPPVDDEVRGELLLVRGEGLRRAGRVDDARRAFAAAVRLASAARVPRLLGRAALGLAGPPEDTMEGEPLDELLLEDAILQLPADLSVTARLRARLAIALIDRGERARGDELLAAALETARASGDAEAIAYALRARHRSWFDPGEVEDRLALDAELLELGRRANSREILAWGHRWRSIDLLETGRLDEVAAALDALEDHIDTSEAAFHRWGVTIRRAGSALLRAPAQKSEVEVLAALALTDRLGSNFTRFSGVMLLWICRWKQGRIREVEPAIAELARTHPAARAVVAFAHAELDRRDQAAACLRQLSSDGFSLLEEDPIRSGNLLVLGLLAEVAAYLHDRDVGEQLFRLLDPFAGRLVVAHPGLTAVTTVDHCLGRLAALLGDPSGAADHFESALARCRDIGAVTLVPRTQLAYAGVLHARGDHVRADALRRDALDTSATLGLGHPDGLLPAPVG